MQSWGWPIARTRYDYFFRKEGATGGLYIHLGDFWSHFHPTAKIKISTLLLLPPCPLPFLPPLLLLKRAIECTTHSDLVPA